MLSRVIWKIYAYVLLNAVHRSPPFLQCINLNVSLLVGACEHALKAGPDYRTCSAAQLPRQPRTWYSRVWEKMLVTQTAATAVLNQHSAARNAFVFVLKTDNFWFIPRQYSSTSEHIHSMFAACLLTVHTSEYHVFGCRVRLCRGICSIVCTGLYKTRHISLAV